MYLAVESSYKPKEGDSLQVGVSWEGYSGLFSALSRQFLSYEEEDRYTIWQRLAAAAVFPVRVASVVGGYDGEWAGMFISRELFASQSDSATLVSKRTFSKAGDVEGPLQLGPTWEA